MLYIFYGFWAWQNILKPFHRNNEKGKMEKCPAYIRNSIQENNCKRRQPKNEHTSNRHHLTMPLYFVFTNSYFVEFLNLCINFSVDSFPTPFQINAISQGKLKWYQRNVCLLPESSEWRSQHSVNPHISVYIQKVQAYSNIFRWLLTFYSLVSRCRMSPSLRILLAFGIVCVCHRFNFLLLAFAGLCSLIVW